MPFGHNSRGDFVSIRQLYYLKDVPQPQLCNWRKTLVQRSGIKIGRGPADLDQVLQYLLCLAGTQNYGQGESILSFSTFNELNDYFIQEGGARYAIIKLQIFLDYLCIFAEVATVQLS